MNFFRKELVYVLILLLGSMSFGLTMAYWSPCKISMTDSLGYSDTIGTLFNFLAPFACIFGGPFINLFINKIGRNISIFGTAFLMFFSWIAMSYTRSNFYYLALISRFLLGFEIGSFSAIIPMYISELIPDDISGFCIIFHQFGISFGVLICYIMGIWLNWRKVALVSSIPTGFLSILIWLVPESSISTKQEEENSVKESLFQKKYMNPLFISILLMLFQQFSGTSAFLANLNGIFDKSRVEISSSTASLIVGLIGSISVLLTYVIIKICGRKIVWYISSIGQAVVLVFGACNNIWKWSPVIPIIWLVLDICLFSIGLAQIPWFYLKDLFNDSIKSSANTAITAINWCFVSVVFFLWDVMESEIGMTWSFVIFAIMMILSLIFGIFALPSQRDVEDMQNENSTSKGQEIHSKLMDQVLI